MSNKCYVDGVWYPSHKPVEKLVRTHHYGGVKIQITCSRCGARLDVKGETIRHGTF